jgi:hypothetical protein
MAFYFDPGVEVNRLELLCFVAMDAQTDLASVYLFSSQIQPLVTLNSILRSAGDTYLLKMACRFHGIFRKKSAVLVGNHIMLCNGSVIVEIHIFVLLSPKRRDFG